MSEAATAAPETNFVSTTQFLEEKRAAREAAPKPKAAPAPEPEDEITEAASEEEAPDTVSEPVTQAEDDTGEEQDTANLEGDEQEQQREPEAAIPAPDFWDTTGKEAFAKLPPEAQKAVRDYEQQRTQAVARKFNEIAEAGKQYQAKREQFDAEVTKLSKFVSETDREISEYEGIDWALEFSEARTPEDVAFVSREKARFESLRQARDEAVRAEESARTLDLQEHHQTVKTQLKQIAPHLDFDTDQGKQRVFALDKYLEGQGIDNATRAWMPAPAMALAWKALQYDLTQHKAAQSAQPKPVTQKPPAGPSVKPTSGVQGSPVSQRLAALNAKQVLSQDEYLERKRLQRRASKRK